ncbi:Tellurite methyltransferase [Alcanivorax sp. ALC70]|jgi:tellurite methyltransferase|nr:Tellurite methyltransferase [Alcanivorax sp. ALC70]|tara:strand:- start:705 stop:1325 length:621 start_codon:yes stop_codon:yes gene_type:complete
MSDKDKPGAMSRSGYYDRSLQVAIYPHLKKALRCADASLPKIAVDAGCGVGRDALFLVGKGYEVHAFDANAEAIARLKDSAGGLASTMLFPRVCSFENFEYPRSSLISACSSLFFCHPDAFPTAWEKMSDSLMKDGLFCGHLMGPNDSWASMGRGDLTVHSRSELEGLFAGNFDVLDIHEHDAEGRTLLGRTKRWHTYSVLARKSA